MYSPYSHSRITCFSTCKRKFKYKYIDKIEMEINSDALKKGSLVHNFLEKKFKENVEELPKADSAPLQNDVEKIITKKLPQNFLYNKLLKECEIIGAEVDVALTKDFKPTTNDKAYFRGSIDILAKHKQTGKYIILDWKTGKSKDKIPELDQVGLYAIYVLKKYKIEECVGFYNYIEHNLHLKQNYNKDKIKELEKLYTAALNQIHAEKEFKGKMTGLCNYCEYKGLCFG